MAIRLLFLKTKQQLLASSVPTTGTRDHPRDNMEMQTAAIAFFADRVRKRKIECTVNLIVLKKKMVAM